MTDLDLKALGLSRWDNEGGAPASGDRSATKRSKKDRTRLLRLPETEPSVAEHKLGPEVSKSM